MTLGHTPTLQTLQLVDGLPLDIELEVVDVDTGAPVDVSGREWVFPLAARAGGEALASFTVADGDEPQLLRASISAGTVTALRSQATSGAFWLTDVTNGLPVIDGRWTLKPQGGAGMVLPGGPAGAVTVRLANRVVVRARVVAPPSVEALAAIIGRRNTPGGFPGLTEAGLLLENQIPSSIVRESEMGSAIAPLGALLQALAVAQSIDDVRTAASGALGL